MSNATVGTRNSAIPTIPPKPRVVRRAAQPVTPKPAAPRPAAPKPAAPKPAAARPTPPPMPAPGRKTGTPRAECPGCQALLPAGSVICVECGLCLTTGRVLRNTSVRPQRRIEEEERPVGFLKIGAGIFTRPVATADSLLAHASQPAMLWKILGFIAFTFVAAGYVGSLGHPALFALATGLAVVRFAVFVGCLVLAGSILGEKTNFLGAVVGVGFVSGCVQLVAMSFLFALYLGAGQGIASPAGLIVGSVVFLVWALFMHVIAIRSVFGCDTFMALVIAIAAAIIQHFATAGLAATLARAL